MPAERPELRARHRIHVVRPGENLYRIALEYGVELSALKALNGIRDPTRIAVGRELLIPGHRPGTAPEHPRVDEFQDVRPDALDEAKVLSQARPGEGCPADDAPRDVELSSAGLLWPVDGVLLARFGEKDGVPHAGIDLGAPMGTPVWAAEAGQVVFAGEQPGLGNLVVIRGFAGRLTLYGRNEEICVRTGDRVERGGGIARLGDQNGTGLPYLYFEIRERDRPVNPALRLP